MSLVLALLSALAAATRLLAASNYRDAPGWVAQARGQDLVTLIVVVPQMLAALVWARRGSTRAFLVFACISAYEHLVQGDRVIQPAPNPRVASGLLLVPNSPACR